jgi:peptidoglycan biosynthesis protein MviN/MurJ (putative lipid II flippase)
MMRDKLTFASNVLSVSSLNAIGLLLGFALNLYIAKSFGVDEHTDALFVSLSIPNLFVYLSGLDSIKGICRTIVIDYLGDKDRLELFISNIFAPITVISFIIFTLILVSSDYIAHIVAPGVDAFTKGLISDYVKILSVNILLVGSVNFLVSIINAFGKFTLGALTLFSQKAIIFSSVFFFDSYGLISVPASYSIGSTIALSVAIFVVSYKLKLKILFTSNILNKDFYNFLSLFKPLFLSVLSMQIVTMAYIFYNSLIDNGSISEFNYAKTISSVVIPLIATPLLTVALNKFRLIHADNTLFCHTVTKYYFISINACALICCVLFINANEVIDVILQRGELSAYNAEKISAIYQVFLISVLLQAACLFFNYVALSKQHTVVILISNILVLLGVAVVFVSYAQVDRFAVNVALVASWSLGGLAYLAYIYKAVRGAFKLIVLISIMTGLCFYFTVILSTFLPISNSDFFGLILSITISSSIYMLLVAVFLFMYKRSWGMVTA